MPSSGWKRRAFGVIDRVVPTIPFRYMSSKQSVRLAFNVILNREPDAIGGADYTGKLTSGELSRHGVAQALALRRNFAGAYPLAMSSCPCM